MLNVAESIRNFNAGREPERLAMKYASLRTSPFVFLRGTCHLFYDRLPGDALFSKAPAGWLCGDAHLENFGSYKGDNRLVYFDLNDFDEAALAPVTWELVRFLSSILVAGDGLRATADEAAALCQVFLDAYAAALVPGKARWLERDTAEGLVQELLDTLKARSRPAFLDHRTDRKGRGRVIRCDGKRALKADDDARARVTKLIDTFAATQDKPGFFKVLDVARRVAGTGSLGVARYIVLVEGKGSPDGNYLLDLKQALPSSLAPHLKLAQPAWPSQAHRVVGLQRRMQAVSMAFLHPIVGAKDSPSHVLRGLQPSEDRVSLGAAGTSLEQIRGVIGEMGQLIAWAQLRSAGRQGSADADVLVDFGGSVTSWGADLLAAAHACAAQVRADWKDYCEAFDAGAMALPAQKRGDR
ncbi:MULTISPECIES: DUF2252 domain-containing protein [unclassified Variovorax]|uniref:DUF2252 domain-containing protein n=1 Tax=unclassified Variovorax TaxID=663243 RepID=UPI0008D659DA|nr:MULTISPECIES: DUF2252 family protein [unclassified Variovorax]SEK16514.1 Uncharacterized conserved protein, DUF2252 family [Variovorax sp. OK202]SFE50108.1 Uncharacterized conserved protein, DUF2252 family [Variovorax sp. OK212]